MNQIKAVIGAVYPSGPGVWPQLCAGAGTLARGFSGQEVLSGMEGAGTGKLWLFEQIPGRFSHAAAPPLGSVRPFIVATFSFSEGGELPPGKVMDGCPGRVTPVLCLLWPCDHQQAGDVSSHIEGRLFFTLSFSLMAVT